MKRSALLILSVIALASCHDKKYQATPVAFQGGKGGNYKILCYTRQYGDGVEARVFIKYATNVAPEDTSAYDEAKTAMPEPGFDPRVQFTDLKPGSYVIKAVYKKAKADRAIYIGETQNAETEVTLDLE